MLTLRIIYYPFILTSAFFSLVHVYLQTAVKKEKMPYITSWDEFSKAAERLYLNDPSKVLVMTEVGI